MAAVGGHVAGRARAYRRELYGQRAPHAIRAAPGLDLTHVRRGLGRCPEIDCLRGLLPPGPLAVAELRSAELGIGADRILVASGAITDDDYVRALSEFYRIPLAPLDRMSRSQCPVAEAELLAAARTGWLPLQEADGVVFAFAPTVSTTRHFVNFIAAHPDQAGRVRVTTPERLQKFVTQHAEREMAHRASEMLHATMPDMCAAPRPASRLRAALLITTIAALAYSLPTWLDLALAIVFLGWTALRLVGALTSLLPSRAAARKADAALPIYTVIVALYRERVAVPGLLAALNKFNYPKEKLDIKIVIEPDDHETHAALRAEAANRDFQIVVAPAYGPRTKPRALNAALLFARGRYLAVYDAEDRPEPDQLRRAIEAFEQGGERLACVQARLTIDNTADSWLTQLYTAEYAGLFDVFLPGLASRNLPLPLGGSSNHFRTRVLHNVGAWDAYNVTEDADLGIRLARFGYRTTMIGSTTYEEAPITAGAWLRQRTRWFKGWMQTWLVHSRRPLRLLDQLGPAGFIVFQLVVAGSVLAALVHPIFLIAFARQIMDGSFIPTGDDVTTLLLDAVHGTTLTAGYLVSGLLGALGLVRRRLFASTGWLLLIPLYWLLLSLAAWRALFQLLHDPCSWEKTEHGLARSSRLADRRRQ